MDHLAFVALARCRKTNDEIYRSPNRRTSPPATCIASFGIGLRRPACFSFRVGVYIRLRRGGLRPWTCVSARTIHDNRASFIEPPTGGLPGVLRIRVLASPVRAGFTIQPLALPSKGYAAAAQRTSRPCVYGRTSQARSFRGIDLL